MNNSILSGRICIVTGASRGIGRAILERFLAEGAEGVIAVDMDVSPLNEILDKFPGRIVVVEGDVREPKTHEHAVSSAQKNFGKVDVLVANAGVFDYRKKMEEYSPDLLDRGMKELFDINVKGYLLAVLAAIPHLKASKGSIVLTASVASLYAGGGGVLYTAAKHAVHGMIKQLAQELSPEIRVNGVGPGGTNTELKGLNSLGDADRSLNHHPEFSNRVVRSIPLGRVQQPEDHAAAYVFLASNLLSPAITGQILMSDGGVGVRGI